MEGVRLDRWTCAGFAMQVLERAGTEGAFTILCRCKKCGLMFKNDFMWFLMRKREFVGSHKSRTRCCCAYCGARSEHEAGTCIVTMQSGDEEEK